MTPGIVLPMQNHAWRTIMLGRTAIGLGWTGLAASYALFSCTALWAGPPIAADDQARTLTNTPVTIPVLTNDEDAATNQLAILKFTAPTHGSVTVSSNPTLANAELTALFQIAAVRLSNSVVQVANTNDYPRCTRTNGGWKLSPASDWISGFFPGCHWYLHEQTGDARFRSWAENWTAGIGPQQYVTTTFDLGFMINNSFGAGYRLTGNSSYKPVVIQAAHSVVAGCYNSAVGCLGLPQAQSEFEVIVDIMMNLELLFQAAALSGDTNLYAKAVGHAERTRLDHIRPDGSVWAQLIYNGKTGAVVRKGNRNLASDHTWSRGQAWATYGFTMVYQHTGDPRFLHTAQRLADYYLANAPADHVPYWDYQATEIRQAPRDSSAAAITLSALVQLSQLTTNFEASARYWTAARHLLDSLSSTNYLAQGALHSGILLHGTGEGPTDPFPEVDVSLIYGDYYFVEALRRYAEFYRHTTLTYVPQPGFEGTDVFTYEVGNSAGACASATVTVLVEPASVSPFTAQISLAPVTHLPAISFPSTAGRFYQVQYQSSLPGSGPWSSLATNIPGSGSVVSVSDTNPASHRFYRVGVSPPPAIPQEITLPATSGVVTGPFLVTNGYIYQPTETGVLGGGRAAYNFTVLTAGNYVIRATANAPHEGANSFFLNLDAEPQDPAMIWDIPVTAGFESRVVSWRGNGTPTNSEFVPKIFTLTHGSHELILRGREAYTSLRNLSIKPYP